MSTTAKAPADSGDRLLLFAVLASLILMNVPYGSYALYPFKLFATWIHESFHAVTALVMGGSVESIALNTDTSGLTVTRLGSGASRFFVSTMGYMGTSLFGAAMLILRNHKRVEQTILLSIAALMALTLIKMGNVFGFIVVLAMAAAFVLMAVKLTNRYAKLMLNVIAAQCCINALLDIRVLFSVTGNSDAFAVQELTKIPYWIWASLWLALSAGIFWIAWQRSRRLASG